MSLLTFEQFFTEAERNTVREVYNGVLERWSENEIERLKRITDKSVYYKTDTELDIFTDHGLKYLTDRMLHYLYFVVSEGDTLPLNTKRKEVLRAIRQHWAITTYYIQLAVVQKYGFY